MMSSGRFAWVVLMPLCSCTEVAEVLTAHATGGALASSASGAGAAPDAGAGGKQDAGAGGTGQAGAGAVGGSEADPDLAPSLSAGQTHNCLARGGVVYCWGDNRGGQLGLGDLEQRVVPTWVPGSSRVVQVSVGERHSCWLDVDGVVSCFGSNEFGQLGLGDTSESLTPQAVPLPDIAVSIDANYGHTCAVLRSQVLYCWGENSETQLGQGDAPDVNHFEPLAVTSAGVVTAVACGQGHTMALDDAGSIVAWGRNSTGEAGVGEQTPPRIREPTTLLLASVFESIDAGQSSNCALERAGNLFCWGAGTDQHLGTGSDATEWSPAPVTPGFVWRQVSTDTFHTCAIDDQARLFCWGRAIEGQLGIGQQDLPQPEPMQIGGTWQAVSVGRFHTCALGTDDRLWCTGHNAEGELGLGDTEKRFTFAEVLQP